MGNMEFIGMGTVAGHQQPTGKPCLHEMKAGASGRLCQLRECYIDVPVQTSLQRRAMFEFTTEWCRLHLPGDVNVALAVAAYLLFAKRLFGLRGGGRAERAEYDADTGWPAIERSTPRAASSATVGIQPGPEGSAREERP